MLIAVGCSSSDDQATIDSGKSEAAEDADVATEQLPDIDPPLELGVPKTVAAPHSFHVHDGLLYGVHLPEEAAATKNGYERTTVTSVDMVTGETTSEVPLDHDVVLDESTSREEEVVTFAEFDGELKLLYVYPHLPEAIGSQAGAYYMRAEAFNVDDGSLAWTQDFESWEDAGFLTVNDTTDEYIALSWWSYSEGPRSHLLDPATGEALLIHPARG